MTIFMSSEAQNHGLKKKEKEGHKNEKHQE